MVTTWTRRHGALTLSARDRTQLHHRQPTCRCRTLADPPRRQLPSIFCYFLYREDSSSTRENRQAAQSSELLDSRLAYNLPPSLAVDEPSLSYSMKGVDINMASYMSELAYIANLVSNHVHSAEMSNQLLNSLALISARYTHTAVDLVSLMSSAYLCCLCQALDLRAMNGGFIVRLKPELEGL